MSGKGKEGTGSPFVNEIKFICIDCDGEITTIFRDLGAGNSKDGPLCHGCKVKRNETKKQL